ncbi:hypothetical protein [Flavobacterium sp.]|uniref:hypothetical protein n=1 Tax=Flavobacterium sp. TaxID=239 RepID=UPI0037BF0582
MKKIYLHFFSVVIIISLFFQSTKFSYLVVEFITNNKAFTEKYCSNKTKPELKCNGKCHLNKEVKKNSDSNKPLQTEKSENRNFPVEILFYQETKLIYSFFYFLAKNKKINAFYLNRYKAIFITKLFHPPQILLF